MDTHQKIEDLKFTIGRFDFFYDSINNKSNILIALNTFILSGVIIGFNYLYKLYSGSFTYQTYALFLLTLVLNILSHFYTIAAFKPFTKKVSGHISIIYFNSIAQQTEQLHKETWESLTEESYFFDLVRQQKVLAVGLNKKFKYLGTASYGLLCQIFSILICSIHIYIIINK